jgi:hypothetical protein
MASMTAGADVALITPLTVCVAVILSPTCSWTDSGTAQKPVWGVALPISVEPLRKTRIVAFGRKEST